MFLPRRDNSRIPATTRRVSITRCKEHQPLHILERLGLNERVWGRNEPRGWKNGVDCRRRGAHEGGKVVGSRVTRFPPTTSAISSNNIKPVAAFPRFHVLLACPSAPDPAAIGPLRSAATCIIDRTRIAHVAAVTRAHQKQPSFASYSVFGGFPVSPLGISVSVSTRWRNRLPVADPLGLG